MIATIVFRENPNKSIIKSVRLLDFNLSYSFGQSVLGLTSDNNALVSVYFILGWVWTLCLNIAGPGFNLSISIFWKSRFWFGFEVPASISLVLGSTPSDSKLYFSQIIFQATPSLKKLVAGSTPTPTSFADS
jgi:hypothetical protein